MNRSSIHVSARRCRRPAIGPTSRGGWKNVLLKAVARDPADRFETAEEFLLALERGASRPLAAPAPTPLVRRDPVSLWRTVAIVSLVLNLLLLYLIAVR
ncbi:hypothetical protein ACFS07_06950 [Undibacterium arcticum]